jgi:peroxiredoxin
MPFQSSRKPIAAISLLVLCAVPIALALYVQQRRIFDPPPIGQKFPLFEVLSVDGRPFVRDSVAGKKLLLLFFTTACSHCKREISNFEELRAKYMTKLDIIGISLDNIDATKALQTELNLNFPVIAGDNEKVKTLFKLNIVPAIFCFDEFQVLRRYYTGEHPLAFDENIIEEFISTPIAR